MASGDYIAQLDGDDFWLPGNLHAQLIFLEKNRECSAVYTNAIVINNVITGSGTIQMDGTGYAKLNGANPFTGMAIDVAVADGTAVVTTLPSTSDIRTSLTFTPARFTFTTSVAGLGYTLIEALLTTVFTPVTTGGTASVTVSG